MEITLQLPSHCWTLTSNGMVKKWEEKLVRVHTFRKSHMYLKDFTGWPLGFRLIWPIGQLSLWICNLAVLVLTLSSSLLSVYSASGHMVGASDFICYIYLHIHPSDMFTEYMAYVCNMDGILVSGTCMAITYEVGVQFVVFWYIY